MATKHDKKQMLLVDERGDAGEDAYYDLVSVWLLRMLLGSSAAFQGFFDKKRGFMDSDIQEFLGFSSEHEDKIKVPVLKSCMRDRLKVCEKRWRVASASALFTNISLMTKRIPLTAIQQQILALVVLKQRYEPLKDCFERMHTPTEMHMHAALAKTVQADPMVVAKAMASNAALRASGLVGLDENYRSGLDVEPMDGLVEALLSENENEEALLRHFLVPAKAPTLDVSDYPHAAEDIALLQGMLAVATDAQEKGVNILLYGTPGSGKSELARLLAKSIDAKLFEVKTEDEDGDPVNANRRMEGYRFCQQMLSGDNSSLILFDEVEDIFPSRGFSLFGMEVKSGENKGWINKALEENPTPAIWICNQISQIDPAFLRRFDYAMELNTPPRSVRLNIVRSRLADTPVSEAFMQRLAEHDELSPAQVTQAAKVLKRIPSIDQQRAERVLEKVLDNSAKAMGQKPLLNRQPHTTRYSLDYLNANIDIPGLVEGLKRNQRGNLCFYGAPGTGKTALAGYIAKQLDKQLLCKRASDILSMWVGGTEQNISRMFEQAKREDAVLVLDEADSLLRDRRGANQSWEVTQVNELLVQMENFDGLFICSTNLMDDLDQASLRRFAIKVEFDYLKPDQAVKMLREECITAPTAEDVRAMAMLSNLAPGDFAAVKKRLDILGLAATPEVMIRELKREVDVKQGSVSKTIGFIGS